MLKKTFIALADAIREHNRAINRMHHGDLSMHPFLSDQIETLADFCQSQNGQFNRERWLGYIAGENGPSGGAVKK
jgi:hypothetical protein